MPAAIPIAMVASSAIGAIASNSAANKAANAAKQAAQSSQINIDDVDQKTRAMALQNAHDSAALEAQMTPEVPQLRTAANNAVLNGIAPRASENAYQNLLMQRLGQPVSTPLLSAAIEKAKADLALGGQLPQDVRNLVARTSMANAGGVAGPGGGLGLGRDITARDLGLTSLQLQNQRLMNAANLGEQESQNAFNNNANTINQVQLLRAINSDQFGRGLSAAQYGESIQKPVVGLDPSSVADIYAGNANNRAAAQSNLANIYGAQGNNLMSTAGNLAGMALMSYGMRGSGAGTSACYLARLVYGIDNPKWKQFRNWLFTKAPEQLRKDYVEYAEHAADLIKSDKGMCDGIRAEMDAILNNA